MAVALTAVLTPSAANAAGTGYFDPVPTVTMLDGCTFAYFNSHLFLTNNNGWSLETRVLYPNGTLFDAGLASGPATDEVHGEDQMVFCHPKDPPGTYTIEGTLTTDDLDASHHTFSLTPITFQVVAPPPPPPPPPDPQVTTKVKLKTSQVNFQPGDRVRFKIIPQATGANLPKVKVRLERKDESGTWTRWTDAFKVPLNQAYVIRKYVSQKRDLKVRARVLPGDRNYGSVSAVSTVNYL